MTDSYSASFYNTYNPLKGPQGAPGLDGKQGPEGPMGPQGPAPTTSQLNAAASLALALNPPPKGDPGPKGEPGEVSAAQLTAATALAQNRANHVGTQEIATVAGLQQALDLKASAAALNALQAGMRIVPDLAARDALYADPAQRGTLLYVNNNNGSATDSANGVYEYVAGAARFAQAYYSGLATSVQPLVDSAQASATSAANQAAAFGLSTQSLNDVVETDQDAYGRVWSRKMRDGSVQLGALADLKGNRIDQITLSNRSRVQAVEDVNSADIPASIKRLRRAFYTSLRAVPQQSASSFVSLSGNDTGATNLIANGIEYEKFDPRIRRLGGPWTIAGTTFPGNQALMQRNVTYLAANGSLAGNPQIELLISAGVTQIEWKGAGCIYVGIMIDGKMTQPLGEIVSPAISSGGYRAHLLTLTPSAVPRRVRLMFQGGISVGSVRVNPEGRLLDPMVPRLPSVYVLGDSITEGTGAEQVKISGWVARYGQMMGFDNIANGGVGGSGWAKSISSGENALSRVQDILNNSNGGPPDLLVCAMGINDSNTDLAPISANVHTFMDQIRAAAPYMPVICLGPFGGYTGWGDQGAKQAAIFTAMSDYRHTYTVDTAPLWANPPYPTWYNAAVDGVHPLSAGHMAIANFVRDATNPILKGL